MKPTEVRISLITDGGDTLWYGSCPETSCLGIYTADQVSAHCADHTLSTNCLEGTWVPLFLTLLGSVAEGGLSRFSNGHTPMLHCPLTCAALVGAVFA